MQFLECANGSIINLAHVQYFETVPLHWGREHLDWELRAVCTSCTIIIAQDSKDIIHRIRDRIMRDLVGMRRFHELTAE